VRLYKGYSSTKNKSFYKKDKNIQILEKAIYKESESRHYVAYTVFYLWIMHLQCVIFLVYL